MSEEIKSAGAPEVPNYVVVRRVAHGVTDHFHTRLAEWGSAVSLFLWGVLLSSPNDIFARSPTYSSMETYMTQHQWSALCLTVGSIRLFALLINGTFRQFKWSPHLRALTSFLSIFVWAQLLWGMLLSGNITSVVCMYPVSIAVDLFNTIYAVGEAAKVDAKRNKDARSVRN